MFAAACEANNVRLAISNALEHYTELLDIPQKESTKETQVTLMKLSRFLGERSWTVFSWLQPTRAE